MIGDISIYNNLELLPQDLQGWNGNSQVFSDLIGRIKPQTIIEIGVWKGQSSINMAKSIKALGLDTKMYCVDTWLGAFEFIDDNTPERDLMLKNGYPQVYYQFLSNIIHNNVQDIIIPFPTTSSIAAKYFKSKGIKAQMIYVDASHDEEDVWSDLNNYYPLLEKGVIFGDDFTWQGMKQTVEKFCNKFNTTYELLENNFWIIEKK